MTDWGEFQNDLAWEHHMEEQYRTDLAAEGVDAFVGERSQDYYLQNPAVACGSLRALATAENLVNASASAALVFAAVSSELTIKSAILRPLLHGLVHNEALARFVTESFMERRSRGWLYALVPPLLLETTGVDLSTYRRAAEPQILLWDEANLVAKLRNGVLHDGEEVSGEDARWALDIASELVRGLFPTVVQALGLATDDDLTVVGGG